MEYSSNSNGRNNTCITGPIIVGAGPSGLATAACLHRLSIPAMIMERSNSIANLWSCHAYDRLHLHLPRQFCELPHLQFPAHYPRYPSKGQFLSYLHAYTKHFSLRPLLCTQVTSAHFNASTSLWHVTAETMGTEGRMVTEYQSKWLVVATGENAEPVIPEVKGKGLFGGGMVHTSEYKNGASYRGKKVLVVGCGNSGMEVSLDLWEHGAFPFLSVNSAGVHVLPREMLGMSTFGLAMKLLKWLPIQTVDKLILALTRAFLGDTEKYGLKRPKIGPLEQKFITGKTPVLDDGTLALIKNGSIKIVPKVETFTGDGAKFVDGTKMELDSVIFATGYKSNFPSWLQESDFMVDDGSYRKPPFDGWKGKNGCYYVGFTGTGLQGAAAHAHNAALDIARDWKKLLKNSLELSP